MAQRATRVRGYHPESREGQTDDLVDTFKNTFDENMLRLWCRLRWKIPIEDVTDTIILTEIDKIITTVKNNSVPDIDQETADALRMDLSESNVHERVIPYFRLCHEIIDDHGWGDFFSDDAARFQTRKAREDKVVLHDLILEKALDHEKAYLSQRRAKRDRCDRDVERPVSRGPSKVSTKKQRVNVGSSGGGPRPPAKQQADRAKVPPSPCPHCSGLHWLSECTTATDSEKTEIWRILRAQRGDKSKRRLKRLRECLPSEEKTVTLNAIMELPYCVDTGADRTTTSLRQVKELLLRDASIN
ncbi:hypothetical protein PHYPSEUDO_010323 [Phytophthora pseudosyringae]|uniref:Uncharacterized protein n=1 Tax=Phytophthora pseudosyringae TaxID=221518 RepID=A0A8T1W9K5_9STRA|nr:hypothetical protein PHYPSEUDO_010323 [Phytophthora pseudosyringae]